VSDFRRFCIAMVVAHALLGILTAFGLGISADAFPKRMLVSAAAAVLWVAVIPNKLGRAA
jgi:hypothetical protein